MVSRHRPVRDWAADFDHTDPGEPDMPADSYIFTSADPDWDEVRRAWNLAVDQRPAAVAMPTTAHDVAAAIRLARERGLRVTAQGTGHGAAALGLLGDTMLINMRAMRLVSVDPVARTARAQAGVTWQEVADAAAKHGLAGLGGSSSDVGVVGYTLGGGMGWLGRAYGLSANNAEAFELVTADGELIRADAADESDLFWALRGGGGSFGVVTAVELRLFPVAEVQAGLLWWPAEAGREVFHQWRLLTQSGLPDEFSTWARFLNASDPSGPRRGRSFAVVDVVHLGSKAEADALLAPLRALRPVTDTVGPMPARDLGRLHLDPVHPVPAMGYGFLLQSMPVRAVDELVGVAASGAATPLRSVEVRHVGGEMSRARPGHGALAAVAAPYSVYAVGIAPTAHAASAVASGLDAVESALSPWTARQAYLNFAEAGDPARCWSPQAYDRLRQIKTAVDPRDMIRANHSVPPARPGRR